MQPITKKAQVTATYAPLAPTSIMRSENSSVCKNWDWPHYRLSRLSFASIPRMCCCVSWQNNNWPNYYYQRYSHYYYYFHYLLPLLLYYYYIHYGSARAVLTTTPTARLRSVERVERVSDSRARRSVFTVSEFSHRPTAVPVAIARVCFRCVYVSLRFVSVFNPSLYLTGCWSCFLKSNCASGVEVSRASSSVRVRNMCSAIRVWSTS